MAKKRGTKTFGERLKKLREGQGLTLEELASQVSMKASYLEELEEGAVLPHVAEIIRLSRNLAVDPSAFMGGQPAKTSAGKKKKALAVRTDDYAYETLTEEDPDRRLMGFRVTIDSKKNHRRVGYQHEGEEFIYVISGKLRITVAGKARTLKAAGIMRFHSAKKHHLKNPGDEPTALVVVIYTP